jgi:hypothetical protein
MVGSDTSEAEEKPTGSISVRRAGKVGALATWDSLPHSWEKEREKHKEIRWMMVITWTNQDLIRELLMMS